MRFTSEEVELLLQITRDSKQGGSFLERVNGISEALSALVPFCTVSAFVVDPRSEDPHKGKFMFRDRDPRALAEYAVHYRHIDPMGVALPAADGRAYLLSDFAPGRLFGRDAYTSDFLPQLGIRHTLAVSHAMPGQELLAFAIHREKGLKDFNDHEREIVRLVSPDIAAAVHGALLNETVEGFERQSETARSGALVFDGSGDLLHADPAAVSLASLVSDRRGVPLDLLVPDVRRLLSSTSRAPLVVERSFRTVSGEWLRVRYTLAIKGARRSVVALLELLRSGSPQQFEALAKESKLTPRERAVAELVVQGLGNRQIGLKLGMSSVTVGVHLTQIYKKTGAAGRNELTTLFLGAAIPARRDSGRAKPQDV